MYSVIVILMVVAAVLMCFIVLIQESKGGGLASDRKGNMDIGNSIGCFQCSFCIFRSFS